jgi:[ribosomal protein S18]-alanine N-acetyltransferase
MTALASRSVHIRPAVRGDLATMLQIERASFSDPWSAETLATALSLERMLVLVADERGDAPGDDAPRLVGYVVALVIAPDAEIADLAVSPGTRRRGVGRALLARALDELTAREVGTVHLEVRESNLAARALYQSAGFRAVGRRRAYYRQPVEDALLLRREIDPA